MRPAAHISFDCKRASGSQKKMLVTWTKRIVCVNLIKKTMSSSRPGNDSMLTWPDFLDHHAILRFCNFRFEKKKEKKAFQSGPASLDLLQLRGDNGKPTSLPFLVSFNEHSISIGRGAVTRKTLWRSIERQSKEKGALSIVEENEAAGYVTLSESLASGKHSEGGKKKKRTCPTEKKIK